VEDVYNDVEFVVNCNHGRLVVPCEDRVREVLDVPDIGSGLLVARPA
jgi:hypothetical protein